MAYPTDLREHSGSDDSILARRRTGLLLGAAGLGLAAVVAAAGAATVGALTAGDTEGAATTSAWAFGLNTSALATVKVGIAVVLTAIIIAAWRRADTVRGALTSLAVIPGRQVPRGAFTSPEGPAVEQQGEPKPLLIHQMARRLWAPMVAMGAMLVLGGLGVSVWWAAAVGSADATVASALTQGTQFLGEGFVLAGISLLLGTVLFALRTGGGGAQAAIGVPVQTLRMPWTAKAFVALMAAGLMVAMGQFVGYALVAAGSLSVQAFAWLGPLREVGLGLLLSGIVLALVTIGTVLSFQFRRISGLLTTV